MLKAVGQTGTGAVFHNFAQNPQEKKKTVAG
jgi:hypothetical protein